MSRRKKILALVPVLVGLATFTAAARGSFDAFFSGNANAVRIRTTTTGYTMVQTGTAEVSVTQNSNTIDMLRSGAVLDPTGPGWSGPTPEPPQIGSFTQRVPARWTVPNRQVFTGTKRIGVWANFSEGVRAIWFSVNAGAWFVAAGQSPNPDTINSAGVGIDTDATGLGVYVAGQGLREYWCTLIASQYPDGPIEVRAMAEPVTGKWRVLESFYMLANSGGTASTTTYYVATTGSDSNDGLTPQTAFLTPTKAANIINAAASGLDYAVVKFAAGTYNIAAPVSDDSTGATPYWVVFEPADGVARTSVIINSAAGAFWRLQNVCCRNLTFNGGSKFFNSAGGEISPGVPYIWRIWLDQCQVVGPGREAGVDCFSIDGWAEVNITESEIVNWNNGILTYANIVRNTWIHGIVADAFHATNLIINCRVTGVENYTYGTGSNAVVDGSDDTKVTPDGWTVTSDDVGRVMRVTSGTGWTPGDYEIESISGGAWILGASPAATGATSGHWELRNGQHPDILQFDTAQTYENSLIVGLDCSSYGEGQGLNSLAAMTDFLVEKCLFASTTNMVFYLGNDQVNFYMLDCTFLGNSYWAGDIAFTDSVIENCLFDNTDSIQHVSVVGNASGLTYRNTTRIAA